MEVSGTNELDSAEGVILKENLFLLAADVCKESVSWSEIREFLLESAEKLAVEDRLIPTTPGLQVDLKGVLSLEESECTETEVILFATF